METFLLYLAIAILFFSASFGIELAFGNRSIPFLKDASPSKKLPLPKVSIIIPARNEEKEIQKALLSILAQDYENLQIIVVNDRSTDQTVAILAQMAPADSMLQIVHTERIQTRAFIRQTDALRGMVFFTARAYRRFDEKRLCWC